MLQLGHMKATIIRYLGKILSVIKQDGFFGGIKKIFNAAFIMLKPVGSGDVLFISSGTVGNSWRYRVKNVAQELELHGFKCSSVIQEHPFLTSYCEKFSIFVFNQVNQNTQVKKLVEKIKAAGKEIIYDTDDLLFDPEYVLGQDFYQNANSFMKKFYEKGVGVEFMQDEYVKTCTTTTNYLADKLRQHNKNVFIVPNKLSKNDVEIANKILNQVQDDKNSCHSGLDPESRSIESEVSALDPRIREDDKVRIGYFSGALSHNKDFATITDALMQIMEKYENVELFLVGPLDIESKLNKFENRIKQFSYAPREKHFANIASVDINIAPLEIGNPFCESKSELKFFEAGVVGVPTIASATQPFIDAIDNGVDGFVANGTEQWTFKLEKLILDENLRKSMGEKAREKAMARYTIQNSNNEEYYKHLRGFIKL